MLGLGNYTEDFGIWTVQYLVAVPGRICKSIKNYIKIFYDLLISYVYFKAKRCRAGNERLFLFLLGSQNDIMLCLFWLQNEAIIIMQAKYSGRIGASK